MAKIFYNYGTLNSAKSLNLLAVAHNYEENGKSVIILKPSLDTRDKMGVVSSRVGIQKECVNFSNTHDLYKLLCELLKKKTFDVVLIDEVQFCTKHHILELSMFCDSHNVDIICYGLRTTYHGELFEGIQSLMAIADNIKEVKSMCSYCSKKSTMNLRMIDGKPIYKGDTIAIGDVVGDDRYIPVCREHFYNPPITN